MYEYLLKRHSMYIDREVVAKKQIVKLIVKLQNKLRKDKENQDKQAQPSGFTSASNLPTVTEKPAAPKKQDNDWGDDGWGDDDGWGNSPDQPNNKDYMDMNLNKLDSDQLNAVK